MAPVRAHALADDCLWHPHGGRFIRGSRPSTGVYPSGCTQRRIQGFDARASTRCRCRPARAGAVDIAEIEKGFGELWVLSARQEAEGRRQISGKRYPNSIHDSRHRPTAKLWCTLDFDLCKNYMVGS